MLGNLEPAEHKDLGPVLIATFMPGRQGEPPMAIVYTTQGTIKRVPIGELSVLWHYDPEKGWAADFPQGEEST